MKIKLLAVGTGMPSWVRSGYEAYSQRLTRDVQLDLIEIPAGHRSKSADLRRLTEKEGQAQLAAVRPGDTLIALDLTGKALSTEKLAETLQQWLLQGQTVCLAIGGPEGLDDAVRQQAAWSWSLSPLTLPHPLVRILVAEQIYRAWTLLQGHPYHR
ncbi:MAG: 23S rRNA (pseudouridine(1915)-N(3))-methyltransferase RlmH [Pseudomonadales bacterium]|nr:23S rRNA (pseudouridine(1915)-N(3))-methyltransferase RlmH [Pseudomonadales bacterium]